MSELNERGQRINGALAHVPERWREAAISWLEREGPEREGEIFALFRERRLEELWREVDDAATASPRELRLAYRMIISALLDPRQVPDETRGALLKRRAGMARNLRRVAQDLARSPAANASLAALLDLIEWMPPAAGLPASEASTAPGSAVRALRDLADALERGEAITAQDAVIIHDNPRRDQSAEQRELESTLCVWLRRATGWPFDRFTAAAVSFALGIETSATDVTDRRTSRESRGG